MKAALAGIALVALGSCGGGGQQGSGLARSLNLPLEVGPVCGDPRILGVSLPEIDAPGGCGIADPVEIYAVGEILLTPRPRLNCGAARALKSWAEDGAQPAMQSLGTRVTGLRVASSYACRRRNGRAGGPLSEHAKGNAIDISHIRLANGETADILTDWPSGRYSAALKRMHAAACGPFGTVLGPAADRFHRDHFHLDTARFGGRRYCR